VRSAVRIICETDDETEHHAVRVLRARSLRLELGLRSTVKLRENTLLLNRGGTAPFFPQVGGMALKQKLIDSLKNLILAPNDFEFALNAQY
jgi:hypothetical protein